MKGCVFYVFLSIWHATRTAKGTAFLSSFDFEGSRVTVTVCHKPGMRSSLPAALWLHPRWAGGGPGTFPLLPLLQIPALPAPSSQGSLEGLLPTVTSLRTDSHRTFTHKKRSCRDQSDSWSCCSRVSKLRPSQEAKGSRLQALTETSVQVRTQMSSTSRATACGGSRRSQVERLGCQQGDSPCGALAKWPVFSSCYYHGLHWPHLVPLCHARRH